MRKRDEKPERIPPSASSYISHTRSHRFIPYSKTLNSSISFQGLSAPSNLILCLIQSGSVEKIHQRRSLPSPGLLRRSGYEGRERLRAGRSPLSGAPVPEVRSTPETRVVIFGIREAFRGLAGWTLSQAQGMLFGTDQKP